MLWKHFLWDLQIYLCWLMVITITIFTGFYNWNFYLDFSLNKYLKSFQILKNKIIFHNAAQLKDLTAQHFVPQWALFQNTVGIYCNNKHNFTTHIILYEMNSRRSNDFFLNFIFINWRRKYKANENLPCWTQKNTVYLIRLIHTLEVMINDLILKKTRGCVYIYIYIIYRLYVLNRH